MLARSHPVQPESILIRRALVFSGPRLLLLVLSILIGTPAQAQLVSDDDRHIVAVLYFDNHTGEARYDALGKGIAEMLITDLSGIPYLRLVERARLQDLLNEVEFSRSDHADPETALEIGRFLAAEYVVIGSFVESSPQIRVDSRVIRTETGEILRSTSSSGSEEEFFAIHDALAHGLIEALELALSEDEAEAYLRHREEHRIADAETAVAFSEALDHYDREEYLEALEKMALVSRRAPGSALVSLTYAHMRSEVEGQAREEGRSFLRRLIRGAVGGGGG
jgi:TolB-like protein